MNSVQESIVYWIISHRNITCETIGTIFFLMINPGQIFIKFGIRYAQCSPFVVVIVKCWGYKEKKISNKIEIFSKLSPFFYWIVEVQKGPKVRRSTNKTSDRTTEHLDSKRERLWKGQYIIRSRLLGFETLLPKRQQDQPVICKTKITNIHAKITDQIHNIIFRLM